MRCLSLVGLTALCVSAGSATTLVAVWSPTQVLLGADSSVVTDLVTGTTTGSACKIGQQKQTFFAFSGLVDDRATGYRADALARQAMMQSGSMDERLSRFLELAREPLTRSVKLVRHDSPARYKFLQQGHPVLQVIFASAEQGRPALSIAGFRLTPDGVLTSFSNTIAEGDDGRGPRIVYAGQQSKIREYLHDHRDWYTGTQPDLVRNLIQLEESDSEGEVGGPVDIVRLTAAGAEWIDRKPECQ